jgi:hypothetical protein
MADVVNRMDFRGGVGLYGTMSFGTFFVVVYICVLVGVGLYLLTLLGRFVKAHERIAKALERENEGRRPGL